MLPSYIQYGVHSPEAAVASLLGVPRQLAEPVAAAFRTTHGELAPEKASTFKEFVEKADVAVWRAAVLDSRLAAHLDPSDVRMMWRQMQGLPAN
jgi:hypothetical protein